MRGNANFLVALYIISYALSIYFLSDTISKKSEIIKLKTEAISLQQETINLLCEKNTVSLVLQKKTRGNTQTRLTVYVIESDSKFDALEKAKHKASIEFPDEEITKLYNVSKYCKE